MLSDSLDKITATKYSFSIFDTEADAFYQDESVFVKSNGSIRKILKTSGLHILGMHNIENTMAALLSVLSILNKMGIKKNYKRIEKACYSFNGLAHRMEMIGIFNGRTFINDSKATTIGAVEMALKSIPRGSILIMGGRTKGDDYSRLAKSIKEKIKHLVLIGESAEDFKKLYNKIPGDIAGSMTDAVEKAIKASSIDDVIILSPACASFDMFSNFEERGEKYREAVLKLNSEQF